MDDSLGGGQSAQRGSWRALPNGLAIAGDLISAGAFLGLTGLVYRVGFDGLVYAAGYSVGYPVITMLFADRMRNLGKFTFADVLSSRLAKTPMRIFAAVSMLFIVIFYLIAQMVGAGELVELLFGLHYAYAEVAVGLLMVCYVIFGGMMATTWVEIIKAVLMLVSGSAIALLLQRLVHRQARHAQPVRHFALDQPLPGRKRPGADRFAQRLIGRDSERLRRIE